jgi:hypothetical protein
MHFCDIFEGLPDFDTVPKLGGGAFGTGNMEEDLKFFRSVHLEPVRSDGAERLLAPACCRLMRGVCVVQGKEDLELERRKAEIDKWNKSLVVEDPTFYTHWKAGTGQLAAGEPLLDGPPLKHSLKANPVERCPWSMMAGEQ